ncbi:Cof-type HAD-IIB family hydrolase [Paenibacillus whitsoniae]|uniref:HAD family phosphatase n=1 Tax=Paenibacillus whitsoniae TaxID=2496558 RepID=A0A3S0A3R1_9BACL|nr:Cof-type HAD-IIB family hydrolase [Paenibacillus whitsoniae]RTE08835.1 HAD family phosphatase [Paenibacillus whitsoniae]
MSGYRLIALDMDGTLLDEDKKISAENKAAIRQATEEGFIVMMSTGRGVISALPFVRELGLNSPMVMVNGSEVWSSPDKLLQRTHMDIAIVEKLHQLALEQDCWWWAYSEEGVFNREKEELNLREQKWLKFGFFTENEAKLERIRDIVTRWDNTEITNSHPANLEMNPKGVSKASGIAAVCKLLGISMSEVIAVGDSENDMAMIREAGLGVAMGNAQERVKAMADFVTKTNEESGVAHVIREYMLKK